MKRKFTRLLAALGLLALVTIPGMAWADEDPVYSLSFEKMTSGTNYNSYTNAHTTTAANIDWSVYGNQSIGDYLRVGGKNTTATNRTLTSSTGVINKNIYKVVINHSGLGNGKDSQITINSIKVEGSISSSFPAANTVSKTITSPALENGVSGTLTFEPDDVWETNSFFRITVNYQITGSNNCYITINSVDFYEEVVGTVTAPTITPNGGTFHGTQTVTITADDGCAIYYTLDGSNPTESTTAEEYTAPFEITTTKTVKAAAMDAGLNFSSITTAVFTQETAATPTFSVPGGYYLSAQLVALSCTTDGAEFVYTTDGSDPVEDPNGTAVIYDNPISITSTTTLKAVANVPGYDWSEVATATYTILNTTDATTLDAGKAVYLADNTQTLAFINLAGLEVIGKTNNGNIYIQSDGAGIKVYGSELPDYAKGDKFISGYLVGTFGEYNGNTQIGGASFVDCVVTHDNELTCITPTIAQIKANYKAYESRYVQFSNKTISSWKISEETDELTIYDTYGTGFASKTTPETTDAFTVKGMITAYITNETSTYEIAPTALADISTTAKAVAPTFSLVGGATTAEAVEATSVTLTPATNNNAVYTKNTGDPIAITAATEIGVELTGTTAITAYGVRDFYANGNPTTYYYKYPSTSVAAVFVANGVTVATVPFDSGDDLTAAMAPSVDAPDGFAFVGWSYSESNTTLITFPIENVTENTTLYAVYAKVISSSYEKVTALSDITNGKYIITADYQSNTYTMKNTTATAGNVSAYKLSDLGISVSGNTLTGDVSEVLWTFEGNYSTGMTVKSGANYLYATNTNNGMCVGETSDSWKITKPSETFKMQDTGQSRNLALYNGSNWRCYTSNSGVQTLTLYKQDIVLGTDRYTRISIREITGYGTNPGGYVLIASPIAANSGVNPEDVGMITDDGSNSQNYTYDLYGFNQSNVGEEWRNYRAAEFNLELGKGYLYANKNNTTLTFAGSPCTGATKVVDLAYDANATTLKGWNLIGNPFATTAYLQDSRDFYRMNAAGDGFIINTDAQGGGNAINVCEGIFVYVTSEGNVTFTTTDPATVTSTGNNNSLINLTVSQAQATRGEATVIDAARIRVNNGSNLPKFTFQEGTTKLYIPQGHKDYAVVNSEARGEMPVNFKAAENGTYTISVETENLDVNYLHLIDNITGMDVDLLTTPSYTFEGKRTDYASRFRLVFDANAGNNETNEEFAFISDGNIIILNEGEATLQVIDIMGRIVSTQTVNGNASVNNVGAAGVYVLQLINGNNVKTQKIVVR